MSLATHRYNRILASLLVLAFSGCIERENPEAVDYGDEVDSSKIAEALYGPTAHMSPADIKANEFTASSKSQTVGLGQPTLTKVEGMTVTGIAVTSDYVVGELFIQTIEFDELGKPQESSREGVPFCVELVVNGCNPEAAAAATEAKSIVQQRVQELEKSKDKVATLKARILAKTEKVTYHRFKKWHERVDAPKKVREQENCGGLPDCKIDLYWLRFEEVHHKDDGSRQSLAYRVATSPSVPYLSKMVFQCVATQVKVGEAGQTVYYEECSEVFNFIKGE